MRRFSRLAALALATCSAFAQIDPCELEAEARWNRFADTSARYLKLRATGVRNVKERERMERQFGDVINSACF
jgi:hypothetical protein